MRPAQCWSRSVRLRILPCSVRGSSWNVNVWRFNQKHALNRYGMERNFFRRLEARNVILRKLDQLGSRHRRAGLELNGSVDALAVLVVGRSKDCDIADGRVLVQAILNLDVVFQASCSRGSEPRYLGGVNVDAARDDHVNLAVHDEEKVVLVQVRDITDGRPVALEG